MKKCKHLLVSRGAAITLAPGVESIHVNDGRNPFICDVKICLDCLAWLPLDKAK